MKYQKKRSWDYEVFENCSIILNNHYTDVEHKYFSIGGNILSVKKGYRWDGATCAIDTDNFMVPSLAHDCLAQAMREGLLPRAFLDDSNRDLQELCKERGMWKIRAWWVYRGVTIAGDSFVKSDIIEVD